MLQKHPFCLAFSQLALPIALLNVTAKKYGSLRSEGDSRENNVVEDTSSRHF